MIAYYSALTICSYNTNMEELLFAKSIWIFVVYKVVLFFLRLERKSIIGLIGIFGVVLYSTVVLKVSEILWNQIYTLTDFKYSSFYSSILYLILLILFDYISSTLTQNKSFMRTLFSDKIIYIYMIQSIIVTAFFLLIIFLTYIAYSAFIYFRLH